MWFFYHYFTDLNTAYVRFCYCTKNKTNCWKKPTINMGWWARRPIRLHSPILFIWAHFALALVDAPPPLRRVVAGTGSARHLTRLAALPGFTSSGSETVLYEGSWRQRRGGRWAEHSLRLSHSIRRRRPHRLPGRLPKAVASFRWRNLCLTTSPIHFVFRI